MKNKNSNSVSDKITFRAKNKGLAAIIKHLNTKEIDEDTCGLFNDCFLSHLDEMLENGTPIGKDKAIAALVVTPLVLASMRKESKEVLSERATDLVMNLKRVSVLINNAE